MSRRRPGVGAMSSKRRRRVRWALTLRDGEWCRACGVPPGAARLTIDHVRPVSLGGTNRLENLQFLCHPCNKMKGNRMAVTVADPERFYAVQDLIAKLEEVLEIIPEARTARNKVGSLAIIDGEDHFVGWIDLVNLASSHIPVIVDDGKAEDLT